MGWSGLGWGGIRLVGVFAFAHDYRECIAMKNDRRVPVCKGLGFPAASIYTVME